MHRSESNKYLVVPAIGHFVPGYLLLITLTHDYLFSSITDKDDIKDLEATIKLIKSKLSKHFGPVIIFEHGSIHGDNYAGDTINHAHLHFIPFNYNIDVKNLLLDEGLNIVSIDGVYELDNWYSPYLFIEDVNGNKYAAEVNNKLESQFLRKQIYKIVDPIGVKEEKWNWKKYKHENNLEITLAKLKGEFKYE